MIQEEFARRIVAMQDTLYHVSATILPQQCDREDAVQEAITKAWQKQSKLRNEDALRPWVIRILINECYNLLRRRKREIITDTLPEWEAAPDALPDVYQLFISLDDKYRLPMALHYVEGYSVEEIAKILRLPMGTIKSQLHRGRMLLRGEQDDNVKSEGWAMLEGKKRKCKADVRTMRGGAPIL
jgi:RNA polymerase sigma-70 factor (ECF subfamily)